MPREVPKNTGWKPMLMLCYIGFPDCRAISQSLKYHRLPACVLVFFGFTRAPVGVSHSNALRRRTVLWLLEYPAFRGCLRNGPGQF